MERIATHRLDGAVEGSLEEALAIASADDKAKAAPPSAQAGDPAAPVEATPAAEAGGAQPIQQGEPKAPPQVPVEDDGAVSPVEGVAAPSPSVARAAVEAEPADAPTENNPAANGPPPEAPALARSPGVAVSLHVQPLASALDTAVKLAADANAAAEALENLKRLLERQLPKVATHPDPSASAAAAAPAGPPLAPPFPGFDDAGGAPEPQLPVPQPFTERRLPAERRRLDVRGFLAGFALSWAFGVVLYLFMTAG